MSCQRLRSTLMAGVPLTLLMLPVLSLPAKAQQDAGVERLPTVDVSGPGNESDSDGEAYRSPTASSTVSATDIETHGGDVREALRDVPGTFTRINPQNPGIAVNIRGMEGAGRVNMMIDGVRQNFRFVGHESQGFTYVDPALLAGVSVERGSVLTTGGGALAGSADFRTIGITDIIVPGRQWGAIGNLGLGSNGVGFSQMFAGAFNVSPNIAVGGAISHRKSHNYYNGDGELVPGTGQDLLSGLLKADIRFNEYAKLALGAVFYNNDFFANSYYQTINNNTYTAKFSFNPDNPLIDFKLNLAYNDLKMTYDLDRNTGSARGRVIHDQGWGIDTSNTSRFMLGPMAVKAVYGVEYFHDDVKSINSAAVPDFGVNPSGKSSIGGVFTQFTFTQGIFDLTAGGRYGFYDLNGSGAVTAGNPVGLPAGPYTVDRSEGRFQPKVTLAARVTDWWQPYVTYSETFRPPTISETLTGGTHPGTGGMSFFPNPFLKPEIAKGWEVGMNIVAANLLADKDVFRMKAAYYNNRVQDYVTACFPPMGFGVYFCNNPGTSTVQGVEVQSEYDAGFAFGRLSYTYTHSDLPSQINGFGAQSYLPDHVFSATAGARFFDRRVTVGARFSAVSEAYLGAINVAPGGRLYGPSYELVDLFTTFKFDNGLEFGLNVTNLFDVAYTGALTTGGGGTPILNGRGRTVVANARVQF